MLISKRRGILLCMGACCALMLPRAWAEEAKPLYKLNEIDMHLHAGMERPVPMDQWADLAAAGGRKVLLMLDHIELYRQTPDEYAEWAKKEKRPQWYPLGADGWRALFDDIGRVAASRKDMTIFKGWEVAEFELDEGIEKPALAMAEVIGWHISSNKSGDVPDGALLLRRIRQIKEVQKEFPVPMIVFHPFTMRLEHLAADARKSGRELVELPPEELRFFHGKEQEEVIRELKGVPIYIEMDSANQVYWHKPALREAIVADVKPLADAGVHFTVSTDAHGLPDIKMPFRPEVYCEPCGITAENANAIVADLLQRRIAKKP